MKIVHFDEMFHPEFGDQINIVTKYQVKQGHDVYIVTGDSSVIHPRFNNFADNTNMDEKDKIFEASTGVKIIRIDIIKYISGRAIFRRGYKKLIDNLKPDILFCHYNDTVIGMYYTLINKKLEYPVIFDSHMLAMASKNPLNKVYRRFYSLIVAPIIKQNKLRVIRTQDDDYVNTHLGVPSELTPFISFGSDTTLFYPDSDIKLKIRKQLNLKDDDFVVVYTGKFSEAKGGKILAEAFRQKFDSNRRVVLLAVGNTNTEYEKQVEGIFNKSNNVVLRFPTQKYFDLPKFYQVADLCVFPKQCSLSFYDAQACGVPVIAEDNNINIERLKRNNGYVYKQDDFSDLRNKILKVIEMSKDDYIELSRNAYWYVKDNYDYENISKEYTNIMFEECMRFSQNKQ